MAARPSVVRKALVTQLPSGAPGVVTRPAWHSRPLDLSPQQQPWWSEPHSMRGKCLNTESTTGRVRRWEITGLTEEREPDRPP